MSAGRHHQHHSVGRGRRRRRLRSTADWSSRPTVVASWLKTTARDASAAHQRRDQALQPASDHAGGRRRRAAAAEGRQRPVHRRRRPRLAGGDVSRRRRRRHASASSTSTSSTSATCSGRSFTARPTWALEAGIGQGSPERDQPARRPQTYETALSPRTRWSCSSRTTSFSTAPTISRRAI